MQDHSLGEDTLLDDDAFLASAGVQNKFSTYADRILPTNITISTFLLNLSDQKYQIPTFQRDVVWQPENVKKLWDSLYKFYPLGSLLVWRTDIRLHSHRHIGGALIEPKAHQTEFHYLLDGQQRTTALYTSIYGGPLANRPGFDPRLFVDLSVESSGDTDDESYRERFLFANEIAANPELMKRRGEGKIFELKTIATKHSLVEQALENSGAGLGHPMRERLKQFAAIFENYRLSLIELNGIEVAEVCQIFERVNTAGKPLSIFDIVVAKTYRPATLGKDVFYLRDLFDAFRADEHMSSSEYRKLDDLDYLQMLAVLVRRAFPDAGVENITERYLNLLQAEHIEAIWEDAATAFRDTFKFLHSTLNLVGPGLVPYRYFYMVLVAYFFRRKNPDYGLLKRYFWSVSFSQKEQLTGTAQMWSHINSLTSETAAQQFTTLEIDKADLRSSSYNSKSRFYRAVVGFFALHKPQDWAAPHGDVIASAYYQSTDKPNLHHVFPRAFVENGKGAEGLEGKHLANSLMCIAYLPQITNLDISAKNPIHYLKQYVASSEFPAVLGRHLIGQELLQLVDEPSLPANALIDFVEARVAEVISRLEKVGLHLIVSDSAPIVAAVAPGSAPEAPTAVSEATSA